MSWMAGSLVGLVREKGYDLPYDTVMALADDYHLLEFFMRVCEPDRTLGAEAAKWIFGTLAEIMARTRTAPGKIPVRASHFREFIEITRERTITPTDAKAVLEEMWAGRCRPKDTAAFAACRYATGAELAALVDGVARAHAETLAAARAGDAKLLNWLVGQVMKAAGGKADAAAVRARLACA